MFFRIDPDALQHGQPDIVQRCPFIENKVMTQFQVGPSPGNQSRGIIEIMDRANVRTKGHHGMIKQAAAIDLLGRF